MKNTLLLFLCLATVAPACFSQSLTELPSGGNKRALVKEQIGLTDISIEYSRPGVKGREGKIWGQLIPAGFTDLGFGSSKAAPWRAGANENTIFECSAPVKIGGQTLPAGKYGLFIAYGPEESTIIFSKNANSWGSYYYNDKEDVLRVKTKPQALDKSVEWLKYEFMDEKESSATVALQWEKLQIPFRVETDYLHDQVESFRNELRGEKGFSWQSWNQAVQWCIQHDTNLDQALLWSDSATGNNFGGSSSFPALSTRAQLLDKMGRGAEATEVMKKALPLGDMNELHQYGRQLLALKKNKEALDVFKANFAKYPNQSTPLMGLTRGYSANGDYKNALKYANQALALAPNEQSKTNILGMIEKLKVGKDVN